MSGAGKSSALRALEDAGFETVDNLPLALLRAVVAARACDRSGRWPSASTCARATSTPRCWPRGTPCAGMRGSPISIVFLDSDTEVLGQRYTESRRPHPLADDLPVSVGIETERRLLASLREHSDVVVDTSRLSPGDLKRILMGQYGQGRAAARCTCS